MRTRTLYCVLAAFAVAAATLGLSALIVAFVPYDSNAAAAAVQQQVIAPKLESLTDKRHRGK